MSRAEAEGISKSTLRRAKKVACILDGRTGFGPGSTCHWKLPPNPTSARGQVDPQELSNYGTNGVEGGQAEETG